MQLVGAALANGSHAVLMARSQYHSMQMQDNTLVALY